LTGGTALAEFYFGHRLSYDLDLFTGKSDIVLPFSRELERRCSDSRFSVNPIRRTNTFRFKEPLEIVYKVNVNDCKDLIVDKLLAFFRRVEPRDAVDLFFILKNESLEKIMNLAKKKDPGFDLYWLAVAFKKTSDFPDNIERWPVEMLAEVDGKEIKGLFNNTVYQDFIKLFKKTKETVEMRVNLRAKKGNRTQMNAPVRSFLPTPIQSFFLTGQADIQDKKCFVV